jgi:hypothetical protein
LAADKPKPAVPPMMAIRFPASALVLEVPLLMLAPWFVKSFGSSKVIRWLPYLWRCGQVGDVRGGNIVSAL